MSLSEALRQKTVWYKINDVFDIYKGLSLEMLIADFRSRTFDARHISLKHTSSNKRVLLCG